MARKEIILIGGGGFCKVVIEALSGSAEYGIYGIIDPALKGRSISGVKVVGDDSDLPKIFKKGIRHAFVSIGILFDNKRRKDISALLKNIGFELPGIRHPSSVIADDVSIGEGSYIAAGAVVITGSRLGRHTIINTRASIDHDCDIGDFVQVAPGAVLCGNVRVGEESHIGAGATVIQGLKIGKNVIVGAGSVVVKDLEDNIKAVGIPAVRI